MQNTIPYENNFVAQISSGPRAQRRVKTLGLGNLNIAMQCELFQYILGNYAEELRMVSDIKDGKRD